MNSNQEETFYSNVNMKPTYQTSDSNYSSYYLDSEVKSGYPSSTTYQTNTYNDNFQNENVKQKYVDIVARNSDFLPPEYRSKIKWMNRFIAFSSILFTNYAFYKILHEYPEVTRDTKMRLGIMTVLLVGWSFSIPKYNNNIYNSAYNSMLSTHSVSDVEIMINAYNQINNEKIQNYIKQVNPNANL